MGQSERGAEAGIEPATGAYVTQQIGFAKAVRIMYTHLHHRMRTSPSPVARLDSVAAAEPARRAADPRVHRCGQFVRVWRK